MANQYKNKVVYDGTTLIDLTGDDVTAADVASGVVFHLPSGAQSTGTLASGDSLGYGVSASSNVGTGTVGSMLVGGA